MYDEIISSSALHETVPVAPFELSARRCERFSGLDSRCASDIIILREKSGGSCVFSCVFCCLNPTHASLSFSHGPWTEQE